MGTYSLDGLLLDDAAGRWFLEKETGVRIMPARTSSGAQFPGRDGVPASLGSNFDPGAVSLSLYVGGDDHAEMMAAWEFLAGVLGQRHRLMPLVHDYGNGQRRQALVEILASSEPSLVSHQDALVEVACQVPGVFWRSLASTDTTVPVTATSATSVLGFLAGSTGPINDSIIRVRGGSTGLVITDPVSGDSLTVTAPLASTEYLVIDCAKWTARKVTTDTWSGGTDMSQYVVSNRGMGPMFTLNPDFSTGAGRIRLTVRGTNPSGSPAVTVRAKSSYL